MKVVTNYICEKCGSKYALEKQAFECENNHKEPIKIVKSKFSNIKSSPKGYPTTIEVEMSDGKVISYKH